MHGVYKPWTDITELGQETTWLGLQHSPRVSILHAYGKPVGEVGHRFDRIHEKVRFAGKWPHFFLNIFDWVIFFPFLGYIPLTSEAKLLSNHNKQIKVNFPDIYATHRWKELAVIKYFLDKADLDFIYMTTSSSYIRTEKLLSVVDSLDGAFVYAGSIPNVTGRFASGANRLISRDAAEKIVANRLKWSPRWLGDYGLGRLCERLNIYCTELKTLNIDSISGVEELSTELLLDNHHFRLKSGELDNRNDIEIMKKLHLKVTNL